MMRELRQIAEQVVEVRPDWDVGGVLNVLVGVKDRGSVEAIEIAAMRAAADYSSRAPVAITFAQFWTPARKPKPTQTIVIANPLPECVGCGRPRRRTDNHGNPLPPPARCDTCDQPWQEIVFRPDLDRDRREAVPPPRPLPRVAQVTEETPWWR